MKVIGYKSDKLYKYTVADSGNTYTGVYIMRSDTDWDRIAVFGLDYRDEAFEYAIDLDQNGASSILVLELDEDSFPDVYDGGIEREKAYEYEQH